MQPTAPKQHLASHPERWRLLGSAIFLVAAFWATGTVSAQSVLGTGWLMVWHEPLLAASESSISDDGVYWVFSALVCSLWLWLRREVPTAYSARWHSKVH